MMLCLNGENREVHGADGIAELVAVLGLPEAAVLVEHNGLALRRVEWKERRLAEGDRVEIVRIVAGG